jgi:hypothetical protein
MKRAHDLGILYRQSEHLKKEGFTNVGWASSPSDRRSTTGYCTLLSSNLVSWKSKKQIAVTYSSAEAKYVRTRQWFILLDY